MLKRGRGQKLCGCRKCHPDLSWMIYGDTTIKPSDVDGLFVVERKRHFLFMEWKRDNELEGPFGMDEALSIGQRLTLKSLSFIPRFTVLVVLHEAGTPVKFYKITRGENGLPENIDKKGFQDRLNEWWNIANGTTFYPWGSADVQPTLD